jgi:guanylate cyclase
VKAIERLSALGAGPDDTPEERARAGALILGSGLIVLVSFVWVGVYLAYDEPVAAAIPATYQVVTVVGWVALAATHRFDVFAASSGVVLWSSVAPLAALALLGLARALPWLVVYLLELGFLLVVDPRIAADVAALPDAIRRAFFALNAAGVALASFVMLGHFVQRFEAERRRSEALLRNVLPASIADRLKDDPSVIAEHHPAVTVLFADLAGFTAHVADARPDDVVALLDEVFTRIDDLADREGLEKIKTIGDAYMLAGGVPEPRSDHAEAVARVAVGIVAAVAELRPAHPWLRVRVGLESGPVIAGVIGRRKFIYDLWGDTVNIASRMESHGVPGEVQVGPGAAALLGEGWRLEPRGPIEIKGKGSMTTYLLRGGSPS